MTALSQETLTNVSICGGTERGLHSRTYRDKWIMLSQGLGQSEGSIYLKVRLFSLFVSETEWTYLCVVCVCLFVKSDSGCGVVAEMSPDQNGAFAPPTIARPPCFHVSPLSPYVFVIILSHYYYYFLLLEACT